MASFPSAQVQSWAIHVFRHAGLSEHDAATTSKLLVRTSLRGVDTHGISRIPTYLQNLHKGTFDAKARLEISERHGSLHCNGHGGIGQPVAVAALQAAMERCRKQAIVSCTIEQCGHLGALGTFLIEPAEAGFVTLLCQRAPALMAPEGFRGAAIGNNPIAFAMPVAGSVPLVFDMAMSKVARGNVVAAQREGKQIPEGWAVDAAGNATTDPAAALKGAMLPMADHKGMGLAMLVECFAGSLAGAGHGKLTSGNSPGSIGAFLVVANPGLLTGREAFDASVRQWLGHYLKAAGERGRYPGQRQARTEKQRLQGGIPVAPALLAELQAAGDKAGLAFPAGT